MELLGQLEIILTQQVLLNLKISGTQTDSLAGGRKSTVITGVTEEYDGSTWTTSSATMGTARYILAGFGSRSSML
jgi:hypothetical protein